MIMLQMNGHWPEKKKAGMRQVLWVLGSANVFVSKDEIGFGIVDVHAYARKSFFPMKWKVFPTDASLSGWGSVQENLSVQGPWLLEEQKLLINIGQFIWPSCTGVFRVSQEGHSLTVPLQWHTSKRDKKLLENTQEEAELIRSWAELHQMWFSWHPDLTTYWKRLCPA